MTVDTIPARLFRQAEDRPDAPALHVRGPGGWITTTWRGYADEVRRAGRALIALGFEPGDKLGILGYNRPEWVVLDLAAMAAGGVPAGIYTTNSPDEVGYILGHAEAVLVLVQDEAQWEKVRSVRAQLPRLRHVVMMRGAPPINDPMVISYEAFLARGDEVPGEQLHARVAGLALNDPATFIYTSGTTGPPKAVMLSHGNLAWTARAAAELTVMSADDCMVSYLPLSHIAEQMFSIHAPITVGGHIWFAASIEQLRDDLVEVQPTIFFGVPRIWEKFHAGISTKLAAAPPLRRAIANRARRIGRRVAALHMRGQEPTGLLALQRRLADRVVFRKLKQAIGLGRARICVTGSAPVGREVLDFFADFDLIILEVYGQSEGSGPTTFNRPGRVQLGTVGERFPGVEVEIATDGEILVRGPNVFLGYYKDAAATQEALVGGWLHTGDLGSFDHDGFLSITGRKKDIIITAGGKNIAPSNIESALKEIDLVNDAVVIGDRRRFLSALVTLDPDAASSFAASRGIQGPLHEHPAIRAEIERGLVEVNKRFARVENVRRFEILPEPLSIERGELTPTLKVKRNVVERRYTATIDAMYEAAEAG